MQLRLVTFVAVFALLAVTAVPSDLPCQGLSDAYLTKHHVDPQPYSGDNLVFFLHVPRTAGRTLQACLLKKGTPQARQCPRAYDHLRINTSMPMCYLLTSHDDFSIVSSLPQGTAVLSHLRDPVDRFLSAYEFAVEVAARAASRPRGKAIRKRNPNAVATEEVWPWTFLAPFFAEDMRKRQAALKNQRGLTTGGWMLVRHPDGDEFYHNLSLNQSKWTLSVEEQAHLLPPLDPYSNPLVMPLEEFVRHPIAQELLHNGQTFQVLGITNYSRWGDAGEMRACMWQSEGVRSQLLELAKGRIAKFIHVGSTNRLMDSVAAAATAMRFSLKGPTPQAAAAPSDAGLASQQGGRPLAALGVEFQRCALQAQQRNLHMEERSLRMARMPDGRTIQFSKAARKAIPSTVIDEIRRLNSLDATLHERATELLSQHIQDWQTQGQLQKLPPAQASQGVAFGIQKPEGPRPPS